MNYALQKGGLTILGIGIASSISVTFNEGFSELDNISQKFLTPVLSGLDAMSDSVVYGGLALLVGTVVSFGIFDNSKKLCQGDRLQKLLITPRKFAINCGLLCGLTGALMGGVNGYQHTTKLLLPYDENKELFIESGQLGNSMIPQSKPNTNTY